MSAHVLIAEADRELAEAVGWYLEAEGYRVTVVDQGAEGVRVCAADPPQVAVLSLQLPGLAEAALGSCLRDQCGIPVLVLGGVEGTASRISELRLGAAEVVTRPLGPLELAGRVKALLACTGAAERAPVRLPGLDLLPEERQVQIRGEVLPLSTTEYDLLALFLRHPRTVLSRDRLSEMLWGDDYYGDLRLIDSHVSHLRRKLTAAGLKPCPIVTVRGQGYALQPGR